MLGLSRRTAFRKASIEHAIIKYHACIRHRQFLLQGSDTVMNTKGEVLNEQLVNLTTCLQDKRKLFWLKVQEGIPLHPNLEIVLTERDDTSDEEIVCHGYGDSSSESESDEEGSNGDCFSD